MDVFLLFTEVFKRTFNLLQEVVNEVSLAFLTKATLFSPQRDFIVNETSLDRTARCNIADYSTLLWFEAGIMRALWVNLNENDRNVR